ncbi:MAG: tautomerase family protein [Desulfarculaceae bacterium]|nr:tautomerase family protein [Desulfarculaceae bacterium]MCF8071098.1 tautomerase family protein [Desulfarculaceae bacterium]MCF8100686.1 tautomerase family protein [Desulfarculaceae bacterium]MCF8118170.1 tautomerase family protein [Desulfarculaceae bacterium]
MPVAVVHLNQRLSEADLETLGNDLRHAVVESLGIPPQFGKVILYTSPENCRSAHPERDAGFVLAEVHLFSGRPRQVKARLLAALDEVIRQHTGLSGENVFIHLIESPKENWGLRGGRMADEVELG